MDRLPVVASARTAIVFLESFVAHVACMIAIVLMLASALRARMENVLRLLHVAQPAQIALSAVTASALPALAANAQPPNAALPVVLPLTAHWQATALRAPWASVRNLLVVQTATAMATVPWLLAAAQLVAVANVLPRHAALRAQGLLIVPMPALALTARMEPAPTVPLQIARIMLLAPQATTISAPTPRVPVATPSRQPAASVGPAALHASSKPIAIKCWRSASTAATFALDCLSSFRPPSPSLVISQWRISKLSKMQNA